MRIGLLLLAAAVVIGGLAFIRLAPVDPARWHTDPRGATPSTRGYVVKPAGGDTAGPLLDVAPEAALAALDRVIRATPRTRVIAGDIASGRITYESRTRLVGYPDYTTIEAVAGEDGTRLLIHARSRFGGYDWGVNRARVEGWLAAMPGPAPAA